MFKKILAILFCLAVTAVFGAYFFFVSRLEAKEVPSLTCSRINVSIQDSLSKNFISAAEIKRMVADSVLGRRLSDINTFAIEKELTRSGVISTAEAYTIYPDIFNVVVTQREPVLRIKAGESDFYCDRSGFILPVAGAKALDLPVVTGRLPYRLHTGPTEGSEAEKWLGDLLSFTERVRNNAYWSNEIEEIEMAADGNMTLYLRKRPFRILFGSATDLDDKFEKMAVFYRTILPTEEGAAYKEVNIKYKNQIICK
jgi:cell division protein FtsQ